MATNQMRREAAKRKLERQQERRAAQAARRRKVAVITSVSVVVLVVAAVGGYAVYRAVRGPVVECSYTATPTDPAAKPVEALDTLDAPSTGTVPVTLTTNRGVIPLTLDRAKAPCTVASFVHLAQSMFYDATPCHRLTGGATLSVLQCGDPKGTGEGGPGYTIKDEPPLDLAQVPDNPDAVIYPRGTVAMAKTPAPDSGGSQFFLVYADSTLPPEYTVFGRIDDPGLAVLDQIAAAGNNGANGPGDGAPNQPVDIESARVPS